TGAAATGAGATGAAATGAGATGASATGAGATGVAGTGAAAGSAVGAVSLLMCFGSEYKAGLAGEVREDLDLAVVACAVAVEDDRGDSRGLGLLGERLAEDLRPGDVRRDLLLAQVRIE